MTAISGQTEQQEEEEEEEEERTKHITSETKDEINVPIARGAFRDNNTSETLRHFTYSDLSPGRLNPARRDPSGRLARCNLRIFTAILPPPFTPGQSGHQGPGIPISPLSRGDNNQRWPTEGHEWSPPWLWLQHSVTGSVPYCTASECYWDVNLNLCIISLSSFNQF